MGSNRVTFGRPRPQRTRRPFEGSAAQGALHELDGGERHSEEPPDGDPPKAAEEAGPVHGPMYSWTEPSRYSSIPERRFARLRALKGIIIEQQQGEETRMPAPVPLFNELRLPRQLQTYLHAVKNIAEPTPIQMQGLPVALSGKDLVGIASTGSGKSMVFMIPALMYAWESEARLPLEAKEGPVTLVLVPSRELARQVAENLREMARYCTEMPPIQILLAVGGISMRDVFESIDARRGIHIVVGTVGRMQDLLQRGSLTLKQCRQLVMDEADRMIQEAAFEEDLKTLMAHLPQQSSKSSKSGRQTLLFSATMPKTIKSFIASFLHNSPVIVNVGRAGAASMDIVQEFVWITDSVDKQRRVEALLDSLQKTPPPVVVFASNRAEVDDILEQLLERSIRAVAIHSGFSQEERSFAIDAFKAGKRDVLVATDVAGKGMDFPAIQHVINWAMPTEIEDYVHRIGRTGRGGKTGIATTLLTPPMAMSFGGGDQRGESVLRDLVQLLKEANQRIPPFLRPFMLNTGSGGCPVCGGLGHGQDDCPKLDQIAMKQQSRITGRMDMPF